jgi:hypothetical protein
LTLTTTYLNEKKNNESIGFGCSFRNHCRRIGTKATTKSQI